MQSEHKTKGKDALAQPLAAATLPRSGCSVWSAAGTPLTNPDPTLHIQSHLPRGEQSARKMFELACQVGHRATKLKLCNSFMSIDSVIRQFDETLRALSEAQHSLKNQLKGSNQSTSSLQPTSSLASNSKASSHLVNCC